MKKKKIAQLILGLFLFLISIVFLYPLILMISISFTGEAEIVESGFKLIPEVFDVTAYRLAFGKPEQIIRGYIVTILFSLLTTIGSVVVQSAMAYPLSRENYLLRGFTLKYLLVTMLFSGGLVPTYIVMTKYLHLGNSFWVYVIPSLFSAWNVILYKTFFQGLPKELSESARIDGANEYQIFTKIILPLSKPILATLAFGTLLGKWNDWNTSLLYIRNTDLFSLQYLLQKILREVEALKAMRESGLAFVDVDALMPTESLKYAMAVLAAGPMLVVFPFFQKYFTKGMVVGSVKG